MMSDVILESVTSPDRATAIAFDLALPKATPHAHDARYEPFNDVATIWGAKDLYHGSVEAIRGLVHENLRRMAGEPGFTHFQVSWRFPLEDDRLVQVEAFFPSGFAPVRIWKTASVCYVCGNGDFGKEARDRTLRAEKAVVKAGELLNRSIERTPLAPSGVALSYGGGLGTAVRSVLEAAVEAQPSNPEYKYFLACAKILQGLAKDGHDEIRLIASEYPDFVEGALYLADPDRWIEPKLYPPWSLDSPQLPESEFRSLRDTRRCYLVSVRDGIRRIVSFVTKVPPQALGPNFSNSLRTTIRTTFVATPYGALVGAYVLIDTHPTQPYTTETFLNVESYHPDEEDLSQTGYWLLRLLAQQHYTYVVLADPSGRVFFNRRVQYDAEIRRNLQDTAECVRVLTPIASADMERLQKAQQYFMDHSSMDSIRF